MPRFGVHVGQQACSMQELRRTWRLVEDLGYDWVSVWDHFYASQIERSHDCFEAMACHAALATTTTRPRVGCLVYSAGYRHPAVFANSAVTIDHLSGGRVELGLGAGWHQEEYSSYGIPFEPGAIRLRRLREYAEIVRALLHDESVTFDGEFWQLREARCDPKALQPGGPRLWIGAHGPRALAQAGQLGDGWNTPFVSSEEFGRRAEIVRANVPGLRTFETGVTLALVHGESDPLPRLQEWFGEAASQVEPGTLYGSSARIIDAVGRYVDAGADWILIAARAPFDHESLRRFAQEVIPAFVKAS
jgi:alkanesulfonate monooxygenase SsuD/methylene tetrahydromethanopterin reductase-like flavin-dependent oxidoreductase (luciferase family)